MVKLETAIETISQMINDECDCPPGWSLQMVEGFKVAYFEIDNHQSITLKLHASGNIIFQYINTRRGQLVTHTYLTNGTIVVDLELKREGLYQTMTELYPTSNATAFLLSLSNEIEVRNVKPKSA